VTDFIVDGTVHKVSLDYEFGQIVRTRDPILDREVKARVRRALDTRGEDVHAVISDHDFKACAHRFGEKYVADPGADLDQFFDIIHGRLFTRSIPVQLAVLYLFSSGFEYRANESALSAAGEAIAGWCMEHRGYQALVRPLGIMPDALFSKTVGARLLLALVEVKSSTRTKPRQQILEEAATFLMDIKSRANDFRFDYEAYLFAIHFTEKRRVTFQCLKVDVPLPCPDEVRIGNGYSAQKLNVVAGYDNPKARIQSLIQLQAATCSAQDGYLTELISDEASRTATLALLANKDAISPDDVISYIDEIALTIGLANPWRDGQRLIAPVKFKEHEEIESAIRKGRKSSLWEPEA
jgi:hypothetical protein